jgi:hypothetical protein
VGGQAAAVRGRAEVQQGVPCQAAPSAVVVSSPNMRCPSLRSRICTRGPSPHPCPSPKKLTMKWILRDAGKVCYSVLMRSNNMLSKRLHSL